jgi:ATP-dependent protease ClpP protease subunit
MNIKLSQSVRDQLRARLPDLITELRARAADHVSGDVRREAGYTIRNAAGTDGDEAVVRVYDEIWWLGVNALDLVADLDTISAPRLRVEINSPGGDVFDGIAIHNALRNHPAYVTTRVDGIAASIASVIAQAGDRRIMQPSSQMMIHNAWGLVVGDNRDHSDMADLLRQQDAVIAGIYAARSGRDADVFRDLMNAESWLTAEAAVAEGLADEIVEPAAKTAPADRVQEPLHAQIAAAVDAADAAITSAVQVSAVRAAAGKPLSNRNVEGLVGLRDSLRRLGDLLSDEDDPNADPDGAVPTELVELAARLYARRPTRPEPSLR